MEGVDFHAFHHNKSTKVAASRKEEKQNQIGETLYFRIQLVSNLKRMINNENNIRFALVQLLFEEIQNHVNQQQVIQILS